MKIEVGKKYVVECETELEGFFDLPYTPKPGDVVEVVGRPRPVSYKGAWKVLKSGETEPVVVKDTRLRPLAVGDLVEPVDFDMLPVGAVVRCEHDTLWDVEDGYLRSRASNRRYEISPPASWGKGAWPVVELPEEEPEFVVGEMYPLGDLPVGSTVRHKGGQVYEIAFRGEHPTLGFADVVVYAGEGAGRHAPYDFAATELELVALPSDGPDDTDAPEGIDADRETVEDFLDCDVTSLRAFLEDAGVSDIEIQAKFNLGDISLTVEVNL